VEGKKRSKKGQKGPMGDGGSSPNLVGKYLVRGEDNKEKSRGPRQNRELERRGVRKTQRMGNYCLTLGGGVGGGVEVRRRSLWIEDLRKEVRGSGLKKRIRGIGSKR